MLATTEKYRRSSAPRLHAAASVPVTPARIEGLRTSSPALGGPEVIAAGMEEVVDLTAERRRDKRQAVETMLSLIPLTQA